MSKHITVIWSHTSRTKRPWLISDIQYTHFIPESEALHRLLLQTPDQLRTSFGLLSCFCTKGRWNGEKTQTHHCYSVSGDETLFEVSPVDTLLKLSVLGSYSIADLMLASTVPQGLGWINIRAGDSHRVNPHQTVGENATKQNLALWTGLYNDTKTAKSKKQLIASENRAIRLIQSSWNQQSSEIKIHFQKKFWRGSVLRGQGPVSPRAEPWAVTANAVFSQACGFRQKRFCPKIPRSMGVQIKKTRESVTNNQASYLQLGISHSLSHTVFAESWTHWNWCTHTTHAVQEISDEPAGSHLISHTFKLLSYN